MPPVRSLLLALAVTLALPASAAAVPTLAGEFTLDGSPGTDGITVGPDGNVYFAVSGGTGPGIGAEFARIDANGNITYLNTPTNGTDVQGLTTGPSTPGGPNNRVWMAAAGRLIAYDPATDTSAEFLVPQINTARGITRDTDGNLWVVDDGSGTIVEVTPAGVFVQEIDPDGNPATSNAGRDIVLGGDGRVWWADFGTGAIHATGTGPAPATESFAVGGNPQGVGAGPLGQVGYANPGTSPHTIGRVAPGQAAQPTQVPSTDPFGITFGTDGAYWFTDFLGGRLGRLALDGTVTYPITFSGTPPTGNGPRKVIAGPNNTLWVILDQGKKIARVTGVDPPPTQPPADTTRPTISGHSASPKQVPLGSKVTVAWTLSEVATTTLVVERLAGGRTVNGRCVKPTRANRDEPKCTRVKRLGTIARSGRQGANTYRFRSVNRRALVPARHRVRLTARDAANNTSSTRTVKFTLLPTR